jgi:hypothetical protein
MSEYKIEKNVKIEKLYENKQKNFSKAHRYPWLQMEINDSFLVPFENDVHDNLNNLQSYIISNLTSMKRYHKNDEWIQNFKIATRRDANEKAVRVWRIA